MPKPVPTWSGVGVSRKSFNEGDFETIVDLSVSDVCDVVYLTNGTLKPGVRYEVTVRELED